MSVVIAIKYKDGIIIGADKQVSYNYHLKCDNLLKIKKSKYSNTAIGFSGAVRIANIIFNEVDDLLDYKDILDNVNLDSNYVYQISEKFIHILYNHKAIPAINNCIDDMFADFLIVSNKNIYKICPDGSVIEFDNYGVIGCGSELVKGYLDTINNFNKLTESEAKQLIKNSIEKSCKDSIKINDKIDYISLYK